MDCRDLLEQDASEQQCRDVTRAEGFPQCEDACAGFPSQDIDNGSANGFDSTGSTSSSGSGNSGTGGTNTSNGGTGGITIDDSDGGGSGEVNGGQDQGLGCDPESALDALGPAGQPWQDEKPWTQAQLMDCTDKCPNGEFSCFQDMCENGAAFVECFQGELGLCAADAPNAPCRESFTHIACCVSENWCLTSQDEFDACVGAGGPCEYTLTDYTECVGTNQECQRTAVSACVAP